MRERLRNARVQFTHRQIVRYVRSERVVKFLHVAHQVYEIQAKSNLQVIGVFLRRFTEVLATRGSILAGPSLVPAAATVTLTTEPAPIASSLALNGISQHGIFGYVNNVAPTMMEPIMRRSSLNKATWSNGTCQRGSRGL